tara:strand:+ start:392 stop:511 length:120 start_codon:yes stop_codon:yes gene_type:complete
MKSKKGKKPAGGGMSGKNKSVGMGNIDAGPEPPLTKVFD